MSTASLPLSLWRTLFAPADTTTPRRPPRRRAGPVLMGDIHGQLGGTPVLLHQWRDWQDEAKDGDA